MANFWRSVRQEASLVFGIIPGRPFDYPLRMRRLLPLISVLNVVSALLALVGPQYIRYTLDIGIPNGQIGRVVIFGCMAIFLAFVAIAVTFLERSLAYRIREVLASTLNSQNLGSLLRLSTNETTRSNVNFHLRQVEYSIEVIASYVMECVLTVPANLIKLGTIFVFVSFLGPVFAWVTLATLMAYASTMFYQNRRMKELNRRMQFAHAEYGEVVHGTFAGLEHIKEAASELSFKSRMTSRYRAARRAVLRGSLTALMLGSLSKTVVFVAFVVLVATGAWLITLGSITVGDLVAGQTVLFMLIAPVQGFVNNHRQGQQLLPALKALAQIETLETDQALVTKPTGATREWWDGRSGVSIECSKLEFNYPTGSRGLHHLSFGVAAIEWVAVVGPNGAGKTTLAAILKRFFEPQRGTLLINGKLASQIPARDLRAGVMWATKSPWFFDDTLLANLTFGCKLENVAIDRVGSLLDELSLTEVWNRSDGGLTAKIQNSVARLSAGQKQRVQLVRAVLRQPKMLILDEGLSGIDLGSLPEVIAFLRRHLPNATVMIMTHRPEEAFYCNRLICLENGSATLNLSRLKLGDRDWTASIASVISRVQDKT